MRGGNRGASRRGAETSEKRELERYAQDQLPMPPELNRDAKRRSRRERSGDNRRGASSEQRATTHGAGVARWGGWSKEESRRNGERKGKDAKDARLHTNTRRRRALSGGCAAGRPDADGSVESEGDGEGGLSGGEAEKGPWRQKSCPVTANQARGRGAGRARLWSVRQSFVGLLNNPERT